MYDTSRSHKKGCASLLYLPCTHPLRVKTKYQSIFSHPPSPNCL